jgi:hypothetical protein
MDIRLDDATMQKTGQPIPGASHSRNGAGTARQASRPLWGRNLVWAIMRLPLKRWPGHHWSLPIGLALSLKEPLANTLKVPYRSRRALARRLVDHVAAERPPRAIRVATDGGDAPQACLRDLPTNVEVVGRCLLTAKLSQLPPPRVTGQRGAPRKKGPLMGSPTTVAMAAAGWQSHPQEAGAFVQSWVGVWPRVFPGRPIRVVVVWRPQRADSQAALGTTALGRLKPLEAFLSPDVRLAGPALLETYDERWAIESAIRDGHASDGRAQDHCRKYTHMVGANTLRWLLAAARTLWCIGPSEPQADVSLQRLRPWYRQKSAPSQFDVLWACRAVLHEAGIFPIPRFFLGVAENQPELDPSQPRAA